MQINVNVDQYSIFNLMNVNICLNVKISRSFNIQKYIFFKYNM